MVVMPGELTLLLKVQALAFLSFLNMLQADNHIPYLFLTFF
jgi:hypothetical protein